MVPNSSPNSRFYEDDGIRTVLESSREAIVVTSAALDRPGPIIEYVNGAFERMTGYTRAEILGQSPRILQGARTDREEMARLKTALREHGCYSGEAINYRKDGSDYIIDWNIAALRTPDGSVRQWISLQRDISAELRADTLRRRAEDAEQRWRALINGVPQLIWRSSEPGHWTWASEQWCEYTGLSRTQSTGWGWLAAVHPDDHAIVLRAWQSAVAERRFEVEYRIIGTDGAQRWFQTRATPVLDSAGAISEWLGTSTDIEDLRRFEQQQRVLVGELQHRTRNLIGVVKAIADETLGHGPAQVIFGERLSALGRAQAFIARADGNPAELDELVRVELAAHGRECDGERIRVDGPRIQLKSTLIQALSLALHELATNALKHGALSIPAGRLEIAWEVVRERGRPATLVLDWREAGIRLDGAAPIRRGFGLDLIETSLAYDLDADTQLTFTENGLRCHIRIPNPDHEVEVMA